MKRELVCVSCPIGCSLSVELSEDGKEVLSVRMLTSTIKVNGGNHPVVPVKTSAPIPKGMMFECMKAINKEVVDAPVKIGEVLISNVCDTGVDIVATNEM